MLPHFPQFKNLELSDKEEIEKITSKHPPYSDFNFISMWAWDIKGEMRISKLNENLVVKFNDYVTTEPFYSFLGDNKVNETIESLLELSKKEGLRPMLKLLPEIVLKDLDKKRYEVEEDPNHFDYIYDINKLSKYEGKEFETKRNLTNRFIKKYQDGKAEECDTHDVKTIEQILDLNTLWHNKKIETSAEVSIENESMAINRILVVINRLNLIVVGIYAENKLVGFCINEILDKNFALSHFAKSDGGSSGTYAFLMKENARILREKKVVHLNYEQHLGIGNLKHAKESFRPINFMKKYICTYVS